MAAEYDEEALRRSALENAKSIHAARQRAERDLKRAMEQLERKSAEVGRALAILRATLDANPDGVLVADTAGRILDANESYGRLWLIPKALMEQRDLSRMRESAAHLMRDPQRYLARCAEIDADNEAETFDVLELSDGRTFEQSTRVVRFEGGRGRVWNVRDVTARVQAEHEHAYLSSIIASSTDAIASKTLGGIITSWNEAAERIFGYTAAEAIGSPMAIIIPPDRMNEEREILARLAHGEMIDHLQTVRMRKDGRSIHVSLSISPVRDVNGRIIGVSKIARDTTERESLLAREKAARERAEQANRMKDDFLATVSHELRNPLNAILGWAQILRREVSGETVQSAVEVIERNARTQARLIEDLLDVSRIAAGKLHLEVELFPPRQTVERALDALRVVAESKGVDLVASLAPDAGMVAGDPARVQQVVSNLVSNAIKFTPGGGRVEVRLERVERSVRFVVSDNGRGIEPDFLPHVFDRFRQHVQSPEQRAGGLGLGLAIVRQLVELHGGTVRADSAGPGQGATFTVDLPLRSEPAEWEGPADEHVAQAPLDDEPSFNGERVLVVDDEPDTRGLLRLVLERRGAEVREAGSVRQACDVLQGWEPTLLVTDIGMPGQDGYVMLERIRSWEAERGSRIPALALTAYARNEDRERALAAGFEHHLAKPIEPTELLRAAARALEERGKRR